MITQENNIKNYLIKYKTVFWDFDGVLKDSVLIKGEAYKKTFQKFGPNISNRIMKHHLDNGGLSRFKKIPLYLSWTQELINKEKINFYLEEFSKNSINLVIECKPIPGAFQMVKFMSLNSVNILITATPKKDIEKILDKISLTNYFKTIYGAETDKYAVIKKVLSNSSNKINDFIFIGDSEIDVKAAISNKIPFLLKACKENLELAKYYKLPFIRNFKSNTNVDFSFAKDD
tara:strand:+ start:62 stop:754 length:693 start_codon:yes stop_codon:yes gene_type:complete